MVQGMKRDRALVRRTSDDDTYRDTFGEQGLHPLVEDLLECCALIDGDGTGAAELRWVAVGPTCVSTSPGAVQERLFG